MSLTKQQYAEQALRLRDEGKITDEVYDAMILNINLFIWEEDDVNDNMSE